MTDQMFTDAEPVTELGTFDTAFRLLPVTDVKRDEDEVLDEETIALLVESFARLGGRLQIQPILVDHDFTIIAGRKRFEAALRSGWTHIGAMVAKPGLSREALRFLEFEENRVRHVPSPLELLEGWEKHAEPVVREEARLAKMRHLRRGTEAPVSRDSCHEQPATVVSRISCHNEAESVEVITGGLAAVKVPEVTTRAAAKQYTGLSLETLEKIRTVRDLSEDESLPEPVKKAALRSVKDLETPGAKVEPALRRVVQAQEVARLDAEDPALIEERHNRDALDRVLRDTSLLVDRLAAGLAGELLAAARSDESGAEDLRAVRVSLTRALALVTAIELGVDGSHDNPEEVFAELSREVSERGLAAIADSREAF